MGSTITPCNAYSCCVVVWLLRDLNKWNGDDIAPDDGFFSWNASGRPTFTSRSCYCIYMNAFDDLLSCEFIILSYLINVCLMVSRYASFSIDFCMVCEHRISGSYWSAPPMLTSKIVCAKLQIRNGICCAYPDSCTLPASWFKKPLWFGWYKPLQIIDLW